MKKKLLFVLPLLLPVLAACGGDGTGSEGTGEEGSGDCEILMWHNSNSTTEGLLNNFVTAFEAENPGIKVKLSKETGDYTAILKATLPGLATGNYPDIFLGYPDSVSQLIPYGKVAKLDPLMNDPEIGWTQADYDDLIPEYLDEGKHYQIPGTYSLPYAKSTEAMYYSTALIDLDLSSIDPTINDGQPLTENYINNLTWEELFDKLCPALMAYNDAHDGSLLATHSKGYQSIVGWSSDENCFITLCEQYGLPYTSFDEVTGTGLPAFNNSDVKNMLKMFYEAHANHYFTTSKACGGSYLNTLFSTKNVLFDIESTGGGQYLSGDNNKTVNFRIAKIPHAAGKAHKVINQGPSLAILKHSDARVKAAWKFYKFITNPKNADAFARTTGYSPIRYSVYDTTEWAEYASIDATKAERSLEHTYAQIANYVPTISSSLFASPVFDGSATCRVQAGGLMGTIMNMQAWVDANVIEAFNSAEATSRLACGVSN